MTERDRSSVAAAAAGLDEEAAAAQRRVVVDADVQAGSGVRRKVDLEDAAVLGAGAEAARCAMDLEPAVAVQQPGQEQLRQVPMIMQAELLQ